MTREECAGLVERALRLAASYDSASSSPFRLALIDGTGSKHRNVLN